MRWIWTYMRPRWKRSTKRKRQSVTSARSRFRCVGSFGIGQLPPRAMAASGRYQGALFRIGVAQRFM